MSSSNPHGLSASKRLKLKLRQLTPKVFRPRGRRHVRRFANPTLGRMGLFEQLHQRNIRYAVLRWFQDLPKWPDGEDVDLLIDIKDLNKIDDLFVDDDMSVPCDIYATSAAKGADMKGLAYFPTNLADQLLDSRVLHNDICYVPDSKSYFLSLAFHAVYHKAESSGLPWDDSSLPTSNAGGDHDYAAILKSAMPEDFGDVSMTITGLHRLLAEHHWSPAIDTLRKYAIFRPSLHQLAPPTISNESGELLMFVFRQSATDHDIVDQSIKMLESKERLEVVARKKLTEQESLVAAANIRGGNWGKGPYKTSGGPPSEIVAFFDYHPKPLSYKQRSRYPHVQNRRVLLKSKIRDDLNSRLSKELKNNCVHTADDQVEANEYLHALGSEFHDLVVSKVDSIRELYRTPCPVIRSLRKPAYRSKTELIQWGDQLAVRKTFRLSAKRYLDREVFAYQNLSQMCDTVPTLLDHDECSLTLPYIPNVMEGMSLRRKNRKLRPYAREVFEVLKAMFDLGRFAIDFHPGNLLLTPEGKLYFVDFEFMDKYPTQPESFEQCADLTGLPAGFDGDVPCNLPANGYRYEDFWQPIFRVPLQDLLERFGLTAQQTGSSANRPPKSTSVGRAAA